VTTLAEDSCRHTQQPRARCVNTGPGPGTSPDKEDQPVNPNGSDPGDEWARALAHIDRDYPGWHAWPAVIGGVLYARRPRTSPPLVVRAVTTDGLRQAIEDAERERGLR